MNLEGLLDMIVQYGLRVIMTLILLLVGWIFAGWIRQRVIRALNTTQRVDSTLKPLIADTVRYAVLLLLLVAVLGQFGVQTASILTVLGGATLAIGLALQGTLSNIASGLMLLFLRPFSVGEYIDADGIAGTVESIGLFTTIMTTFDGVYQEVPNSNLWNRVIKNYSRLPTRRIDIVIGISYEDDIDRAKGILQELLNTYEPIFKDPPPQVMVIALADSSVNINMRCWVKSGDYFDTIFYLTEHGKKRLDAAGISIPFPQTDVHLIPEKEQ